MTEAITIKRSALIAACLLMLYLGLAAAAGGEPAVEPDGGEPAAESGADRPALGLDDCLRVALERSHDLRVAEYRAGAADAGASRAQAHRLPTVGFSGSYDFTSEVTTIDLPGVPGFAGRHITLGDENRYALALGVQMPVFTGGALTAAARAEGAAARAAAYDLEAEKLLVTHEVRAAFFRALGARAGVDVAGAATARLGRHVRYLKGQLEVGAASREMRVQAEAALAEAQRRELLAEDALATAELALGSLLGRPGERVAPDGGLDEPLVHDDEIGGAGVGEKPELAAASSRCEQSRERTRAAKGSLMPSVSAAAAMNYGRPGVDLVQNEWMSWASAGVSVSWTLWDWGARRDEVRAAEAAAQALEAQTSELNRRLENALAVARARLDLAREGLGVAADRLALERQRLELVTGRYDQGMATETELLDAQDDLAEADAAHASSLASLRLAEVDLIYAIGR
jgi:outer membrane protein